mgnify:CR=1 FL=1|tara:strand:+ start:376 stop:558 length:183 start_codon:yes stop_codon:yes gene_type:complete
MAFLEQPAEPEYYLVHPNAMGGFAHGLGGAISVEDDGDDDEVVFKRQYSVEDDELWESEE